MANIMVVDDERDIADLVKLRTIESDISMLAT